MHARAKAYGRKGTTGNGVGIAVRGPITVAGTVFSERSFVGSGLSGTEGREEEQTGLGQHPG